jgi:hypothetical protein
MQHTRTHYEAIGIFDDSSKLGCCVDRSFATVDTVCVAVGAVGDHIVSYLQLVFEK